MFDIGWSEMAIVMLVAIIVIGPKDLPRVARTVGQWTGKARAMAREFHRSLDDMAREAELDDIKKSIEKVGSGRSITKAITDTVDPDGELESAFKVDDKPETAVAGKQPAKSVSKPAAQPAIGKTPDSGESKPAASAKEPAKPMPKPTVQPSIAAEPQPEKPAPTDPVKTA